MKNVGLEMLPLVTWTDISSRSVTDIFNVLFLAACAAVKVKVAADTPFLKTVITHVEFAVDDPEIARMIPGSGTTYGLLSDGLFAKNSSHLPEEAEPSNPHPTAPREAFFAKL